MAAVTEEVIRRGVAAALENSNSELPVDSEVKIVPSSNPSTVRPLEQWVDEVIASQTRRRGRRTERRRKRNPTAFYGAVVEQLETEDCPCCDLARAAFGEVDNESDLANTPMAVDPENLQRVLDFLKYIFENLLPILLKLI